MSAQGIPRDLEADFLGAGQEHVFRFVNDLSAAQRDGLIAEARNVDLDLLARLSAEASATAASPPELAPFAPTLPSEDRDRAAEAGRALLARGEVGFYLVAGGQGTRLGFTGPKGRFPIGPRTGKILFHWHAEKVLAASQRYGSAFPWVIMVSRANEEDTRRTFEENSWFGLEDRIRFVRQRMIPALDDEGRILLASPSRIALAPNGHGGAIEALADGGALPWLRDAGVRVLSFFQVDNPLLNAADPLFLGHHALRGAEMGAKVVRKSHPLEKAGVVATVGGRPGIVEYSELPEELARQTDDDGEIRFGLANIAAHTFDLDFLERMAGRGLPWHCARKKVLCVDGKGRPAEVMGRKFEMFIFDAIPEAKGFFAYLTDRREEFSPLKNAEGDDSPESVKEALDARTIRWHRKAGVHLSETEETPEVSPISACDLETFRDAHAPSGDERD